MPLTPDEAKEVVRLADELARLKGNDRVEISANSFHAYAEYRSAFTRYIEQLTEK
jgi:hypothetical protein